MKINLNNYEEIDKVNYFNLPNHIEFIITGKGYNKRYFKLKSKIPIEIYKKDYKIFIYKTGNIEIFFYEDLKVVFISKDDLIKINKAVSEL